MFFQKSKLFSNILLLIFSVLLLISCGADARKYPPDPRERVQKNLEEGRGFRLADIGKGPKGGTFDFASSNELWRASLDTIDFIPLASANYSGGIIITDWYSDSSNSNEAIKISIRFLTNEIRSDALDIKIFYKMCNSSLECSVSERPGELVAELKKKILSKAAVYEKQAKDKNFKPYKNTKTKKDKD